MTLRWRLGVGVGAIAATLVAGVILHHDPGANPVDRAAFALIPVNPHRPALRAVTWLGALSALLVESTGAALVAWLVRGNRRRAVACLLGPPIAAAINQLVLKPVVGRHFLGELSFASGSVVVVAAAATAWTLAVPTRARPVTAIAGAALVVLMVLAVVALEWHYPSDALAGVTFGVGVVLLIDVALVRNDESG